MTSTPTIRPSTSSSLGLSGTRIQSGEYKHLDAVPASRLAGAYGVSMRVAYAALAMLAANRYVSRVHGLKAYRVTWDAQYGHS